MNQNNSLCEVTKTDQIMRLTASLLGCDIPPTATITSITVSPAAADEECSSHQQITVVYRP